jgi:hypothetical protein
MRLAISASAVAGLSFLACAVPAQASFIPVLTTVVSGPGPNTTFNYDLVFTTGPVTGPNERLDSSLNPFADFATIYDIPGFVSASAGTGFTANVQNLGSTAGGTAPADNAGIPNVTFAYTSTNVLADTTFGGFSIVSSFSATAIGQFTSETTRNGGPLDGSALGHIGLVQIPVPEPVGAPLLLSAAALLRRRR